jgi:hypothetical protein
MVLILQEDINSMINSFLVSLERDHLTLRSIGITELQHLNFLVDIIDDSGDVRSNPFYLRVCLDRFHSACLSSPFFCGVGSRTAFTIFTKVSRAVPTESFTRCTSGDITTGQNITSPLQTMSDGRNEALSISSFEAFKSACSYSQTISNRFALF